MARSAMVASAHPPPWETDRVLVLIASEIIQLGRFYIHVSCLYTSQRPSHLLRLLLLGASTHEGNSNEEAAAACDESDDAKAHGHYMM